jgi:hypothetical protein
MYDKPKNQKPTLQNNLKCKHLQKELQIIQNFPQCLCEHTVVLTLNPAAPENGIIFSLPQAVPAGQIKSFAIPQQKETIN